MSINLSAVHTLPPPVPRVVWLCGRHLLIMAESQFQQKFGRSWGWFGLEKKGVCSPRGAGGGVVYGVTRKPLWTSVPFTPNPRLRTPMTTFSLWPSSAAPINASFACYCNLRWAPLVLRWFAPKCGRRHFIQGGLRSMGWGIKSIFFRHSLLLWCPGTAQYPSPVPSSPPQPKDSR